MPYNFKRDFEDPFINYIKSDAKIYAMYQTQMRLAKEDLLKSALRENKFNYQVLVPTIVFSIFIWAVHAFYPGDYYGPLRDIYELAGLQALVIVLCTGAFFVHRRRRKKLITELELLQAEKILES